MRLYGFRFKARKHWDTASIKNLGQVYHQFTSLMPFGRPSRPLLQTRTLNTSGPSTIWSGLTQPQGLWFSCGACCLWRASLRRLSSWSPLWPRHRPRRRCVASLLTLVVFPLRIGSRCFSQAPSLGSVEGPADRGPCFYLGMWSNWAQLCTLVLGTLAGLQ